MEPDVLKVFESSATKVGSDMDILSIYIWPKLEEKSQDKLLTVCKKWRNEISTTFNLPRPQRMNWMYAKTLVLSSTKSSLKVVRMEEGHNENQGKIIHFKWLYELWKLLYIRKTLPFLDVHCAD